MEETNNIQITPEFIKTFVSKLHPDLTKNECEQVTLRVFANVTKKMPELLLEYITKEELLATLLTVTVDGDGERLIGELFASKLKELPETTQQEVYRVLLSQILGDCRKLGDEYKEAR